MAYIPPHKRHKNDAEKADPLPDLLASQFRKNLSIGSPKSRLDKRSVNQNHKPARTNYLYANNAVSRWFAVGSMNDDVLPASVCLEPVPLGFVKHGESRLVLVNNEIENTVEVGDSLKSPWITIAENVVRDLLSSFQCLMGEVETDSTVEVKPALIARFGKITFLDRAQSFNTKTMENSVLSQSTLRNLKKMFNTNMPSSYLENITSVVARGIGLDAEELKETYQVKLSDMERPDATITCKCKVNSDGRTLELFKIELNQVRHAVMDISCLAKKLDLRLMLCAKRIITNISDDEKCSIQAFVNSAVLDSNVKGGLRWPLGKDCSADCRFSVVGVWHTKSESFKNLNLRLRARSADRFDFRTSTGEFSREVVMKLAEIVSKLKEPDVDASSLLEVLADNIKVIWNNFLHCYNFLDLDSTISS